MIMHRENACAALNHLIDVYRAATNDFRVRHVMPDHDVISLSSEIVTDEGKALDGMLAGGRRFAPYPVRVRQLSDPATRQLFEAMLASGEAIPASREYLQEGRRLFHERDFKLAVILASTALEVQWAELLEAGMEHQGVNTRERRKRLRSYTTPTANKGTLGRLDLGLREVFSRSLQTEEPDLWAEINGQGRQLRKNVIHPKIKTPHYGETLAALIAIERAMRWLRDQMIPIIIGEGRDAASLLDELREAGRKR